MASSPERSQSSAIWSSLAVAIMSFELIATELTAF
jgi:hypothetical protein